MQMRSRAREEEDVKRQDSHPASVCLLCMHVIAGCDCAAPCAALDLRLPSSPALVFTRTWHVSALFGGE